MPTISELRERALAAGKTEAEIQQIIAREVSAGTLEAEPPAQPLIEYKPFSEMESPPEVGGLTGVLHDIYTRPQRQGEFLRQVQESEPFTRSARRGEFLQEVTTGRPSEYRQAKEAALAPAPEEPLGPATPSLLAPGAGEVSLQATQTRPIPMPTTAGMEEAQAERQRGLEEQAAQYGTALTKQTQQYKELADIEAKNAEAARKVYEQRQLDYEKFQTQRNQREARRQDYIKGEVAKVQGLVDQLQTSKVDPYSFYKHPDGSVNYPKSIAAAIAVGLGALGASLPAQYGGTGGPNVALQIIDKAIAREIDAQKSDIANKRAGVGLQMNMLSMARQVSDDERQQEAVTELGLLKGAEMMLAAQLARTGAPKAIASGQLVMAQIQEKEATVIGNIINNANDKWVQDEEKKYMMESRTAAAMAKAQAPKLTAQTAAAPPGLEVLPGYQPISQKEWEKDRELAKKAGSAYYEAMGELQKMLAWRRKYGAKLTPKTLSKVLTEGQVYLERTKSAMRKVDDTGARLDAGEIQMMGLMDNIGQLGQVETQIQTVMQSVTDKMNGRMRTLGHRLKPAARIEGEAAAQ